MNKRTVGRKKNKHFNFLPALLLGSISLSYRCHQLASLPIALFVAAEKCRVSSSRCKNKGTALLTTNGLTLGAQLPVPLSYFRVVYFTAVSISILSSKKEREQKAGWTRRRH